MSYSVCSHLFMFVCLCFYTQVPLVRLPVKNIMSLKKTPDFKSQTKRTRAESERTANNLAERKNKRPKSKRVASPTTSYLSGRTDWSMDPPTNFKSGDTFPLHSRIKRKRQTSPVTSYISLKSDNPVNDSRGNTSMLRVRGDSPTPTCLSLRTDWSMDLPTNFRPAETFPLDQRLLAEHHLRCPLCKSVLKDPVSIPCGHNYCRGCISEFWVNWAEGYVCPQCGNTLETRPVLNTNAALSEVVKSLHHAGFSPALPPQSYAGPEDVACDFCTERRLKAVKRCSTCGVFLCETHIKPHYTVAVLQKHTLSDVTGDMKTRPSEQHQNAVSSFSSTVSAQQDQREKTLDIIKETAVRSIFESVLKPDKLQTQPKRSAKPKTRDNKEVRSLVLLCSTLKKEVSGIRNQLSKISKRKNTKKEKHYEEDEDCSEEDSDERSDDEGRDDDSSDEEEDGSENSSDNRSDEEEDGSENSSDEEEDGSENSSDEEEDGSHKGDGEDSRDDEEDDSAFSDEESDDKYSEGYNDHSSEEYSTEDEDDGY